MVARTGIEPVFGTNLYLLIINNWSVNSRLGCLCHPCRSQTSAPPATAGHPLQILRARANHCLSAKQEKMAAGDSNLLRPAKPRLRDIASVWVRLRTPHPAGT